MSNAILASCPRSFNGAANRIAAYSVEADDKAFVSISTAAKAIGMSPQFLRLAEQQGRVTSLRTVGGNHRRYSIAKLKSELFGVAEETVNDERRKVAVYGRVSSVSQKEALKTQIDDTIKRAAELEKVEPATIAVYKEICSSFKDRPELNRLIDDIIADKLRTIYIAYRDRLSRTPALTSVILHLCEKHGVKIVYLYTEAPKSDIEELTSELVEFVTLIGNRQAAAKSKKVTQKNIPLPTLQYCLKLYNQGIGLRKIIEDLNRKGMEYENGGLIKESCLRSKIKALRKAGFEDAKVDESSIEQWFKANAVKTEKATPTMVLYSNYVQFCDNHRLTVKRDWIFQNWLVRNGVQRKTVNFMVGPAGNRRCQHRSGFIIGLKG